MKAREPREECSVLIEAGKYRLLKVNASDHQWPYWLENKDGEGMSLSAHDLDDMLDRYFKENF